MPQLIAVLLLGVAAVMLLGRLFVTASPGTLARLVKGFGVGVAAVLVLLLTVTGRLPLVLAFFAALIPWAIRMVQLHGLWRYLRNAFGGGSGNAGDWHRAGTASPNTTQVETRWLRMTLNHDSGHLEGEVLDGPYRGRLLSHLSLDEARLLYRDIQGDAQSRQVMEAWLDRVHSGWREPATKPPPPSDGPILSRSEAHAILGLRPGASVAEIKAAHHRLMLACHPDHGGSDWLAARLNQAKDVLLGE